MKLRKSLIIMLTLLLTGIYAYSETTIGVVNFGEVIAKSKKGLAVQKRLENLQKQKSQKAQTLQNQVKKLQNDLMSPAINPATRERKTEELNSKQIELKRYVQDTRRVLERQYQKELFELEKELVPLVQTIGKRKGLTAVLDFHKSGIVYFDKTRDITAEVLKEFNSK